MLKLFKRFFEPGAEFDPARTCPECGSPLYRTAKPDDLDSSCPNMDCPARIRRLIAHWCSSAAMNIPVDEQLVRLLVSCGLARDASELYRLRLGEIGALPGVGAAAAAALFDAVRASTKLEGWRALFGLGISAVGVNEARKLLERFGSVDNVFAASADRLIRDAGVPETAARNVVHWHGDPVNRRLVKRLFKAGVNFKLEVPRG